jgi:hypothetical protein
MNQKGFAPIFIALIVLGVIAISGAGVWYATSGPKSGTRNDVPTPVVQDEEQPPAPSATTTPTPADSNAINGRCGSALSAVYASAPATDLCAEGSETAVASNGSTWQWDCKGSNGGTDATCYANVGGGSSSPTPTPPMYDEVNGHCGSALSGIFSVAPTSNLCSSGITGAVTRSGGTWQWNCGGSGGGTDSACYANVATAPPVTPTPNATIPTPSQTQSPVVNGVCGSSNGDLYASAPTNGLCSSGAPTSVSLVGSEWKWICSGMSGGANVNCAAQKPAPTPTPVNGDCGTAYNGFYKTAPTSGLCSIGTASAVTQVTDEWRWSCLGSNGGTNDSCFADVEVVSVVSGQCGSSNGGTYENQPTGLCTSGTATAVTQSNYTWLWSCNGSNGGTNSTCQADVEIRIPSYTVTLTRTGNDYTVSGHINYYGKGSSCSGPRYYDPVIVRWGDAGAEPVVTNMSFSANHEYFIENATHPFSVSVYNSCFGVKTYRTDVVMHGDSLWLSQTETIPLHE